MRTRLCWRLLAVSPLALALACGSHWSPTSPTSFAVVSPPPGGVAQFSFSPVELPPAGSITALGGLNPPGHVMPTEHAYFYLGTLEDHGTPALVQRRNVYAPATATVEFTLLTMGTGKVIFDATSTFSYYLDHITPRAGLAVGSVVQAGEVIGTADSTVDLGAIDTTQTLTGFVNPARYRDQTRHAVSPWKYFVEPLRSEIYARIYRAPSAPDKDGKIDFDIAGRLVGAWFDPSLPMTSASSDPVGWPKTIAFVYDYYDPSAVRISIGGTIAPAGVWGIEASAPRPEAVSVGSGKVSYRLMGFHDVPATQYGLMIVQMLSSTEIKVEVFVGSTGATADFDNNAFTFVR